MRRVRLVRLALAAALSLGAGQVFFGTGVASAQGQGGAPPPAAPPAPAAPPGDPAANPGLARQVTLTPQEMLAQADAALVRMEGGRTSVAKQLAKARQERDVVKTLCLNDKLNQLDVALRSATERRGALELAAKRGDGDLSNHEFTILSVLRSRADQIMVEANQCVGEEAGFAGDAAVSMTVDGVPDDDADVPDFTVVVEPPQCLSCFQ
jgi:hypothetical protein